MSEPKRYFIRTFGCQMNEHDSERIAGMLEAEGYARAADAESADLVVLNTCAIRENADNKLYGNLGHLKNVKESRPELRIAVGGCLVQKDKHLVIEKAPWVDSSVRSAASPRSSSASRRRSSRARFRLGARCVTTHG
jgi:tRNA-2-methylthio-N6-dimethylallyladenosine synthase